MAKVKWTCLYYLNHAYQNRNSQKKRFAYGQQRDAGWEYEQIVIEYFRINNMLIKA